MTSIINQAIHIKISILSGDIKASSLPVLIYRPSALHLRVLDLSEDTTVCCLAIATIVLEQEQP